MKKNLFLERKALPKEIKQAKMELIDRGFSRKITDEHTNLRLFTTNFTPVISTKRIIPRMRWLELVYAMPYLVLKREIFNSFKKTKNVLTSSAKQIWNIFMHLEFPLSRYEDITTRLHRFSREIMKIQDPRSKIQVKPVSDILYPVSSPSVNLVKSRGFYFKSSSMELAQSVSRETATTGIETEKESAVANYQLPVVIHQPPVVSHKPSAVSYKKSNAALHTYGLLERDALQNGQKIFSYFNFKTSSMELAQPVSHETATTRIETEKESAFANYRVPVVTTQPPVVSHKPSRVSYKNQVAYILTSTREFVNFSSFNSIRNNKQTHLNTLEVEKAPIYHTYPKIEHVSSTHTEIIKERVIEKEEESKPPHATPQSAIVDVNRIADQVYSFIERKIRIEKERRGFYG